MRSGIFDKNGVEVSVGDTLVFPYITPCGELTDEDDFEVDVVFKYGCYGFETEIDFIPLMEWMFLKKGDYVPNCGNEIIYTEKYKFKVK